METFSTIILKKSFHIVSTLLFYAVIFLMLLFTVANIHVRQNSDIANVFGSGFHSIQSESDSEDQNNLLLSKDIAFVKMLDESLVSNLVVGDIVTYYDEASHRLVTHRIIDITTVNETLYFTTQGDQSLVADEPIQASSILAVYQSSINGLGSFLDYLQSPLGFAIFIIFPVLVMMLFESVRLYESVVHYSKLKSEARVKKSYRKILKNLEHETSRIRHEIMSNWISEKDYEKITKIRI